MGSFLVGRSQKRYNRPVEVYFVSLNDITLVGSATFCSILKLSCDLIRWYTVLYFLPKRAILLPTNDKITGLVGSQNGANIHWSVPTSLQDPAISLYTSVVDFLKFRLLVESPLKACQFHVICLLFIPSVVVSLYISTPPSHGPLVLSLLPNRLPSYSLKL